MSLEHAVGLLVSLLLLARLGDALLRGERR